MLGEIDAKKLLLPSEQLAARRLGAGERAAKNRRLGEVEQSHLSTRAVALLALGRRERRVQHVELRLSRSEGIAGPAANQRFHHTLVSALQVDPCAEIVQRTKRTGGAPRLDDAVHRAFADILHRAEPEPDALCRDREVEIRLVHVWRQYP